MRLAKTVLPEDDDGVQQIVCYDKGIGTGGLVDKYVGGMFGEGIDIKIQELYSFLALNYDDGDETYLFGFSRGAYTVRSLAGMIHNAGLVRRDHLDFVEEAYELYREKVGADTEEAKTFRSIHGHRVPITCIACFDTVGALGIPDNFGILSLRSRRRYEFLNTTLNPDIQNAIHVLSIDEERARKYHHKNIYVYILLLCICRRKLLFHSSLTLFLIFSFYFFAFAYFVGDGRLHSNQSLQADANGTERLGTGPSDRVVLLGCA